MTSYEFWEELSKIFNAVVSYQEKSVEFNKQFISPWIRIGNVFDNQDRNREMIAAYKNAIEIAPKNAQNWFDLGNLYLKESNYEDAIHAFQRAIEMNPDMGQAYSDLGTVYLACSNHEQAIVCFERSITLLADSKEKAVSWNRLGNLYRKTQQYSLALEAFQHADELDSGKSNTDENYLNVVGNSPDSSFLNQKREEEVNEEEYGNPENLIIADAHMQSLVVAGTTTISGIACNDGFSFEDTKTQTLPVNMLEQAVGPEVAPIVAETPDVPGESQETFAATSQVEEPALPEPEVAPIVAETPDVPGESQETLAATSQVEEPALPEPEVASIVAETPDVPDESQETFAATSQVEEPALPEPEVAPIVAETLDVPGESRETLAVTSQVEEPGLPETEVAQVIAEIVQLAKRANEVDGTEEKVENPEEASNKPHDATNNFIEAAYEEYLRNEDMYYSSADLEQSQVLSPHIDCPDSDPVTMIDSFGDVKMEVDINNPKVWNELGNVYYKNGAIEDAIIAYAKSIELDRCFAWPYSNLALAYVQKERLAESVLLYQHAIELFNSEKDKAIAWNCLGNVYRRMEDYPNAIFAYQRADAMDPNSISTSLQPQYSLLGTLAQPQETLSVQ